MARGSWPDSEQQEAGVGGLRTYQPHGFRPCPSRRARWAGGAVALHVVVAASSARGEPLTGGPEAGDQVEVVVRGSTAQGYASTTSSDTAPREPIDAASMLAGLPSVHVRRLGADGSFGTVSVRGSAAAQVAVFLAGVPLTSAADPAVDVGTLPLWPGARFRVHRGFAPASLGTTGYLGGVLAIDPPDARAGSRTESWLAAGSFGSLKVRAGDVRRIGDLALATGVHASRTDSDFTYQVADPVRGAIGERVRENAHHVAAGAIHRAEWSRPWGALGAMIHVDARRQGVPGSIARPTRFASLEGTRLLAAADVRARAGPLSVVHAALWGRRETSTFADPRSELDRTRTRTIADQIVEATGGSVGWRARRFDSLTLGVFADGRAERFGPGDSPGGPVRATRIAGGVGCETEWRATRALTLAASCRLDARRDEAEGADVLASAPSGPSTDFAPSGHAGASLRIDDTLVLSAHAGALWRPPSFVELYGDRGALLGDPSLRPERAIAADVGAHGAIALASRATLAYEVVAFATRATDLVAFVQHGQSTLLARNVDRAVIAGGEAMIALLAPSLRTSASYTLLATENLGADPVARGRPLPGRPVHDLAYDAAYRVGPVRVRYAIDAIAGTTIDVAGTAMLPARVLHAAGIALDVPGAPGLRAGVDVTNLFDQRVFYIDSPLLGRPVAVPVSDFFGFPLAGRAVWVTVRYAIEGDDAE